MFPYSFYQPPKSKLLQQQDNIAREIQELKESLANMTSEEQAAFWDDIEGLEGENTAACEGLKSVENVNSLQVPPSSIRGKLQNAQTPKWWQFWKKRK